MASGGNYKRCDCCGNLKPEEELEEVTITIKKCKECDLSKASVLEEIKPRPEMKSLGGAYSKTPRGIADAFIPPLE